MKTFRTHLPFLFILWIFPFLMYLKTVPPSILYIDAGTMLAGAFSLGIPNPPGFPFFMIIGHLFTKLPLGDVLFRLQLLSISSAIGVLTCLYFVIVRFITSDFIFLKPATSDKKILSKEVVLPSVIVKVCALTACLILAFSYEFWSQALNSESYIFTNFLMMIILTLVFTTPVNRVSVFRRGLIVSFVLGLASGANPTIVQVVPTLILSLISFRKYVSIKLIILMILITIVTTIVVYSYLPIRAMQNPFLNWGNPQTPELLWGHLRGAGLDINDPRTNSVNGYTGDPKIFMQSVGRYVYLLFIQFTPFLLPFIMVGMYYVFRKNKYLFFNFLAIPITNLIFGGIYLSGNQESWFIASYIIFSLYMGAGLLFLAKLFVLKIPKLSYRYLFFLVLLFLVPFLWWFPKLDRSGHIVTEEYARNLYDGLPKNTILIGSGDFFNSLSHYERVVVGKRPDVFPIVANMWYILPWYRDNLRHQKSDIMPLELEKMIKKDRYEEYREVMNWYIEYLINKGYPVYVTPMVFRESVLAGTDWGKFVVDSKKLKLIESGLAYRILTAKDLLTPDEKKLDYKFKDKQFYKHPPFYLERNYNGAYKTLLTEYATSFIDLSEYYLSISNQKDPFPSSSKNSESDNLKQKSIVYVEKAYEFAPFSPEILNRIAVYKAFAGKLDEAVGFFKQARDAAPNDLVVRLNLANALFSVGKLEESKAEFQIIFDNAQTPEQKQEGQKGLAKINQAKLAQTTSDWKRIPYKDLGFEVSYPLDWTIKRLGNLVEIKSPDEAFSIYVTGGYLGLNQKKEQWVLQYSPVRIKGSVLKKGPAQVIGFDAVVVFWEEQSVENGEKIKTLELVMVEEAEQKTRKHILHTKVSPSDSPLMKNFDQIISSIKLIE